MTGGSDQRLVERIESLEDEVEEQRLLLRYALERFGGEAEEPDEKVAPAKAGVRGSKIRPAGGDKATPDVLPRTTTVRRPDESRVRRESSGKPVDEKEGPDSFGALADLFRLRGWEWWLNKIGIGLLLFGVVFLFKFSVDQGWLTPEIRVGFGLVLGAVLVWLGLRVYEERRAFSQVLLGGGIGTFYITGFAAFQLYALVPYALAFMFLVVVTLLAFALAVRQDQAALSVIGAAGGFGTPFLLYDGSGGLSGLVVYASLILAGISAIYLYKGWRSLLLFSALGVWAVLFAGYSNAADGALEAGRLSLGFGVLFATLMLWLVPVAREVLRLRQPPLWPVPEPGTLFRPRSNSGAVDLSHPSLPAHLLAGVLPLAGLAFTQEIWDLSKQPLGWVAFGGAVAYVVVAWTLRRVEPAQRLSYTNALVALLLFTLGIVLVLEGNALFFTLVAEAAVLHLVSSRLSDRAVAAVAHSLFFAVGVWLSERILSGVDEIFTFGRAPDTAFLNVDALLDLSAVALALGISKSFTSQRLARVYRIFAHVALLGLLFRELISVPGGDTVVFLSWAAYALALLLLSRRYPQWGTVVGSHTLWGIVGLWLAGRLTWDLLALGWTETFGLPVIADLVVICMALLASTLLTPGRGITVYRVVAHAAVLAWLWRVFDTFPDGAAYVTVSWGIYAASLLVLGLRRAGAGLVRVGVITLFLLVGKLFLVDLVWADAVWRILLFLGFGALFLVLSYYLQALWKTKTGSPG